VYERVSRVVERTKCGCVSASWCFALLGFVVDWKSDFVCITDLSACLRSVLLLRALSKVMILFVRSVVEFRSVRSRGFA